LVSLRRVFDPQKPTALFIGRYQPFHTGHQRLIEEGLRRVGQMCVAVRDTHRLDEKNPLPFFAVKQRIEAALSAHAGPFVVISLPNVTHVFYGRDVGYGVERIALDEATEAISATKDNNYWEVLDKQRIQRAFVLGERMSCEGITYAAWHSAQQWPVRNISAPEYNY
jgi:cytidyltransferase-like protein